MQLDEYAKCGENKPYAGKIVYQAARLVFGIARCVAGAVALCAQQACANPNDGRRKSACCGKRFRNADPFAFLHPNGKPFAY